MISESTPSVRNGALTSTSTYSENDRSSAPRPRTRQLFFVIGCSLLFWAAVLIQVVTIHYRGDIRGLFVLGSRFEHPTELAGAPTTGSIGYDGQFFAALATDPFLLRTETVRCLDVPMYRAGRIGLPLLAWVVSGGNANASLIVYQFFCWLGALAGIWVAAHWLAEEGHSPLRAIPLVVSAGLVSSMVRSLPDATAAALVVVALWLYHRNRLGLALLAIVFSCLTRETGLIAAVAIAIEEIMRRRRFIAGAIVGLLPLITVIGWRLWAQHSSAMIRGGGSATLGFTTHGVPATFASEIARPLSPSVLAAVTTLAIAVVAIIPLIVHHRTWRATEYTYAGFAALAVFTNYFIHVDFEILRIIGVLPVLAVLLYEQQGNTLDRVLLRAVPFAFAAIGAFMTIRRILCC